MLIIEKPYPFTTVIHELQYLKCPLKELKQEQRHPVKANNQLRYTCPHRALRCRQYLKCPLKELKQEQRHLIKSNNQLRYTCPHHALRCRQYLMPGITSVTTSFNKMKPGTGLSQHTSSTLSYKNSLSIQGGIH